ncbi:MAG: 50S ribosomal protein L28 [Rickettsiales bacterium]
MSKRCDITGTGSQSGNNVSHSNRKTRTRFMPNLQHVTLKSEVLGVNVPLRVTAATLRSIEHNGGLDGYLLSHSANKMTEKAAKLKRQIKRKMAAAEAA